MRVGYDNAAMNSFGAVDNLVYIYADGGNQLEHVKDHSNKDYGFRDSATDGVDYRYDANGSLVMDRNKGIGTATQDGITYNHLNLPTLVAVDNGTDMGNISYVYDALGTKLQKTVTEGANTTTTSYTTGYVYKNGNLEFFPHSEGYVTPKGSGYRYVYQYKDHLGNVRLSYTENPSNPGQPTIIEENNYYPFGLKMKGFNNGGDTALGNDVAKKWKYNGQESEEGLGLNVTEMTFRQYDPALGRFHAIDPMAEMATDITPYRFGFNNPIVWADPSGLFETDGLPKGADGLTNDQWMALSRPGGGGHDAMRAQGRENFQNRVERSRGATVEVGQGVFGAAQEGPDCSKCPIPELRKQALAMAAENGASPQAIYDYLLREANESGGLDGLTIPKYPVDFSQCYCNSGLLEYISGGAVLKIAQFPKLLKWVKGLFGAKTVIKATGQAHHLIGTKIVRALNNHPTLKGAFDYSRTNSKYIYNAIDAAAHKGYQNWHRRYDATVVKWLQSNPSATPAQFDKYLHNLHQQPWLKSRIPNVNLLN
ncbi:MAG: RHS repeat-associated core domain-containing protein [Bacteroidota bacterium]